MTLAAARSLVISLFFVFVSQTILAQANDNFANAQDLLSSNVAFNTSGTLTSGATYQTLATPAPCTGANKDVWYKFTAQTTGPTIRLTTSANTLRFEVRTALSGGTSFCGSTIAGTGPYTISGAPTLTVGTIYYIRVFATTNPGATINFDVSIQDPTLTNDLCANAPQVPASVTCFSGSLNGTTHTSLTNACDGGKRDIWYRFIPQTPNPLITLSGDASLRFEIRSSCTNNAASRLFCSNKVSARVAPIDGTAGLTVGAIYWIRIYSATDAAVSFTLCFSTSSNDACSTATQLLSSPTATPTSGSLDGGSTYTAHANECAGTNGKADRWYAFVAKSSNPIITVTGSADRFEVKTGCDGTSVFCSAGTSARMPDYLEVGTTYFIRVYSSTNTTGAFTVNVVDPPANNECATATTIQSAGAGLCNQPAADRRTLSNATYASLSGECAGSGGKNDVWYKFVAQTANPTVTVADVADLRFEVRSSCGSGSLFCSASGTGTLSGLSIGATYFIRVYSTSNTAGTFTVCVTDAAPANDLCGDALLLSTSGTCTQPASRTLAGATNTAGSGQCGSDRDVWYKFVAVKADPKISVAGVADLRFEVRTDCGNTAATLCSGSGTQNLSGLNIGTTYYIRVYSTSNTTGTFTVCVTDPVYNNECASAQTLTLGTTAGGNVLGATGSGVSAACGGNADDDVWYSFEAERPNASVTLSGLGVNLASNTRFEVFSGGCGGMGSIGCGSNTTPLNLNNLIYGQQYYVRVYSNGSGQAGFNSAGAAFNITVANTTGSTTEYRLASGRMAEVFKQVVLSGANLLDDPWEVTYGQDGFLWITESKGYRVQRMDPATGAKTTVLDLNVGASGYMTAAEHTAYNKTFTGGGGQGGLAGLALHPDFLNPSKKFVYISYIHTEGVQLPNSTGKLYTNRIVRFEYADGVLKNPKTVCDTLPGSSDHNSQRMIIAPVDGTDYLFYASGDMGSGQFSNAARPIKSQITASYEGKILRFNLEQTGGGSESDKWIPDDNPFNGATQSAVWSTGIRNNQGFAYGNGKLYGSSHGPYSDDEINVIEKAKNYGHPLVIGYAADGNYNGSKTGHDNAYNNGASADVTIMPMIRDEITAAAAIPNYKDPLFSAYPVTQSEIHNIWINPVNNGAWPSEGWSGMDLYTGKEIPGWKNSLLLASLKWGRMVKLKLNADGSQVIPTADADTVSYFGGKNRYRDLALAPNGREFFVIMDKNATTSGPSALDPIAPACGGCLQKYTFLGYQHDNAGNKSTIPTSIPVTAGTANNITQGTPVTIDASNNDLWVPITGPDGNIMAEIKANGNNLGTVRSAFYTRTGTARRDGTKFYLNRNITINPAVQPTAPVSVRLYITLAELNALIATPGSGVTAFSNLKIYKNNDTCSNHIYSKADSVTTTVAAHGVGGFVLQANINSFSSFYFASGGYNTLPLQLLDFKGVLERMDVKLHWKTVNERHVARFDVERSLDGAGYETIGTLPAGNTGNAALYNYTDKGAAHLPAATAYYRLKMVDDDGTFTYSNVAAVRLPKAIDVRVFPNPVKTQLNISINNPEAREVVVQVSDVQGRVLHTLRERMPQGTRLLEVDVRRWSPQLYFIKVLDGAGKVLATGKFEKQD